MRIIGLDFGSKTVGVAVSDELGLTAQGVEIIRRESPKKLRRTLARIEELEKAREIVQKDFNNPKLDLDYRNECWNLLNRFDNAIGKIKWNGKEYGYPVHSSNGWHLLSDD